LRSIGRRQQLIDVAVEMTADDPGEDVGEISERVDVIQFTGFDQGGDGGPMPGAAVRTCEQCILSIERDRAHRTLDDVVIQFDAAVAEEARKQFRRAATRSKRPLEITAPSSLQPAIILWLR
jgi:hypothetical protein